MGVKGERKLTNVLYIFTIRPYFICYFVTIEPSSLSDVAVFCRGVFWKKIKWKSSKAIKTDDTSSTVKFNIFNCCQRNLYAVRSRYLYSPLERICLKELRILLPFHTDDSIVQWSSPLIISHPNTRRRSLGENLDLPRCSPVSGYMQRCFVLYVSNTSIGFGPN